MEQKFSAELFKKNVSALEPCPIVDFDYSKQTQGFQYMNREVLSKVVKNANVTFDFLDMDAFTLDDLVSFAEHMENLEKVFSTNDSLISFFNQVSAIRMPTSFI